MTTAIHSPSDHDVCIWVLGTFKVQLPNGAVIVPSNWLGRNTAKTLVKVLALAPNHRMHREQVIDMLWPDAKAKTALGSLSKSLHAARRALEPTLTARVTSAYIPETDDLLTLRTDKVWIDADAFESAATAALGSGDLGELETAAAAYGGELLPEDRYEDWTSDRRSALSALHDRVLLALAHRLHTRGAVDRAEGVWKAIVTRDPTREDVHRALMCSYAARGMRAQAIRQYRECREALAQELGVDPQPLTEALHRDVLDGEMALGVKRPSVEPVEAQLPTVPLPCALRTAPSTPLVGRDQFLEVVRDDLESALAGNGRVVLIGGESGMGRSRTVAEVAREAHHRGAAVLWGTAHAQEHVVPYGPFVEALEGYLAGCSAAERSRLATRSPILSSLIPALQSEEEFSMNGVDPQILHGRIFAGFARLLAELEERAPVCLALEDLHAADAPTLRLLQHLTSTAGNHRWFILGTYHREEMELSSEAARFLSSFRQQPSGRIMALSRLSQKDTERLVQALLPDGEVASTLVDRIYALSLGNLLLIGELVQSMRDEGTLLLSEGLWIPSSGALQMLPGRVSDLTESRLRRVGPGARRFLELAAVKGMEFSLTTMSVAASLAYPSSFGEEQVLEILDEALASGILEDRGEIYAFAHPLMRAELLRRLPSHRRSRLHAAIAEAMERDGSSDGRA